MYVLIPAYERDDLPAQSPVLARPEQAACWADEYGLARLCACRVRSRSAAGTLAEDVARRLLKEWHDWVLGQRDPLYLPVELTPERAKTVFLELRLTRPLSPIPQGQLSAREVEGYPRSG